MSEAWEKCSKSKKKKLRKLRGGVSRTKLCDIIAPDSYKALDHGYRFNYKITKRFCLYKTSHFEKLPSRFILTRKDLDARTKIDKLLEQIAAVKVGADFDEVMSVLQKLDKLHVFLLKISKKILKLNMKALLDKYCPKTSLHQPTSAQVLFNLLKSVMKNSGLQFSVNTQNKMLDNVVKKLLTRSSSYQLTVGEIVQNFDVKSIDWLQGLPGPVQWNIFSKFITWIIKHFLNTLLNAFFHCTDSTHRRHQIFFYRKSVWQAMTDKALRKCIESGKLKQIKSASQIQRIQSLSSAPSVVHLRFIPKKNLSEVRLITNKFSSKEGDPMFVDLVKAYSGQFGSRSDLSGKVLGEEWSRLVRDVDMNTKLFWITADIEDAFGSVNLNKLVKILKNCCNTLYPDDQLKKSKTRELCRRMFLHTAVYDVGTKQKTFLMIQGLVQGDPLSSFLSDIYYGDMVNTEMTTFINPPEHVAEVFLRGADDFIFVSTDKKRVEQFQQVLLTGVESYNCYFKLDKTSSNLDDNNRVINFCGSLIDSKTREVVPSYSVYENINMFNSVSWRSNDVKPGLFIMKRFLMFCTIRQTRLYYGPYNSKKTLLTILACNIR